VIIAEDGAGMNSQALSNFVPSLLHHQGIERSRSGIVGVPPGSCNAWVHDQREELNRRRPSDLLVLFLPKNWLVTSAVVRSKTQLLLGRIL